MQGRAPLPPQPHVALRRQRLEALVDLSEGTGLEIGPLDSPIGTRPPYDVRYVDVLDTEHLRQHYGGDPAVVQEQIVDVDFSLQGADGMRTLAEAVSVAAPYRWVIASHVVEHVPDLVGWLADVAAVLEDGGRLMLVVPDRRYTFDAMRPATTVGQVLQAHSSRDTVPSERAVYDHYRSVVHVSAAALWAGAEAAELPRAFAKEDAVAMRERALRGDYVDCHVWVFSPAEFVAQLGDLSELDLCDFAVERVLPTPRDELEFIAVLQRLPRHAGAERRAALRRGALSALEADGNLDAPVAPDADDGPRKHVLEVSAREVQVIRAKRAAMARLRAARARMVRRPPG